LNQYGVLGLDRLNMWIVEGPFDGDGTVPAEFKSALLDPTCTKTSLIELTEAKLLKPGTSYQVGRSADSALRINHKKVSKDHCKLVVGEFSVSDVVRARFFFFLERFS
jgi:hypothetical protein